MQISLPQAAVWGLAQAASSVLLLGALRRRARPDGATLLVSLVFGGYMTASLTLWRIQHVLWPTLAFPWLGKVVTLVAVIVCGALRVGPSLHDTGIARSPSRDSYGAFALLAATTVIPALVFDPTVPGRPGAEQTMFELLMPGLDEEFLLRGTLLAMLDRAYPPRGRILGIPIGIGFAWNAVMFPWLHVFAVDGALRPRLDLSLAAIATLFVFGAGMTAIRRRTGSVWPCVFAHNAANSGIVLFRWLHLRVG